MSVPSNLIPIRVTQLPVAPVADENSLLMIVYQGNNYQIRAGDLISVAGVPVTRQVIAGTGMTGGGALSSNVTLSIAPGGVGSTQLANSGVTAGSYGTTTDIPVFTVDATGRVMSATTVPAAISGYVPDTRQVIAGTGLSGGGQLSSNVTLSANLSNATPLAVFQSGSAGTATDIARSDHKHPAVNLSVDDEVDGTLAVANGGTGATTAPNARANLSAAVSGANNDITSMTSITGGISSPDFIQFDAAVSPLPADATAKLYYNNEDQFQTLSFQMNGSVVQKIGEEQYFRVKCSSAVTKGQVVMFTGTLGASGGLTAAPATGLTPGQSNYLLGIATETGATNDWIFVTYFGEVKGINTTGGAEAWANGTSLYYNPAVTGGLTKNKPTTPNAIAIIAAVVHAHASNGILFIRPTYGTVLGGTDGNVQFGTLNNGDVVVYDGIDQRWENAAQSALAVGTATNLAGGAASQVPYQTGAGATAFIANGTAGQVFKSNGASAPSWANIDGGTF